MRFQASGKVAIRVKRSTVPIIRVAGPSASSDWSSWQDLPDNDASDTWTLTARG